MNIFRLSAIAVFCAVGCATSPPNEMVDGSGTGGDVGTVGGNSKNTGGNANSGGNTSVGGTSAQAGASAAGKGGGGVGSGGSGGTVTPVVGCTGTYRNLFKEIGHSDAEVNGKLTEAWNGLFEGGDSQRIFYKVGSDEAYILDVINNDVRSEGMSYGMMIALQMNKRDQFDSLWRWTIKHMRHNSGTRKGYFAWQCGTDGQMRDQNPASDGEAYFATALLFASARWGNTGAFNYLKEAQDILYVMLHKEDNGVIDSVTNMFNKQQKMVVFTPYAAAAKFTDPSYHLPAFYEVWANAAVPGDQAFWKDAATTSRAFFSKTMHPTTGLAPDYANFDGSPTGSGHSEFRFDAWRVISNLAVDSSWWGANPDAAKLAERLLNFFRSAGLNSYGNQFELSGKPLPGERSPGLIAMNALGALALPAGKADDFVRALWSLDTPSGKGRYYDGTLYFMALLHASGNFKAYGTTTKGAMGCP
jgi:oligosaccharide reducing-end xylanase